MKTAYFDCSSGIAGNMIIGALLDAGLDANYLKRELNKLRITHYDLRITKAKRGLLSGTLFDVKLTKKDNHRNLKDIFSIIKKSKLSKDVKTLSSRIFKRLAEAESKVHGIPVNKVHFHEVGAIDAIIDIVGTCIGLEKLGIEKVFCSAIAHGKGTIKHAHGILPIPAPATTELLKSVPVFSANVKGELVTPTGAAIITTIASGYVDAPRVELETTGFGAGSKIYPSLINMVRVFIGESEIQTEKDAVLQIEANIDDMNPKFYDKTIAKLMKAGALDAYISPIRMKKQRQAVKLIVLCSPDQRNQILDQIFTQTTTFGVRIFMVPREKLSRKFRKVKIRKAKARVKIGLLGNEIKTIAPEYEDYKRISKKHHIPLKKAYDKTLSAFVP
jgi:uncharacterized protein (TIGR00299 family) protein